MSLIKLYFTPSLLLLVLSCPLWQPGQSMPMVIKDPVTDDCVSCGRVLLQNITEALSRNDLFHGINCTEQSVELNTETNTPSVCAPMESACSGNSGRPEFHEDSCRTNIREDLHHYYKFLAAQPDPAKGLEQTLFSVKEVMESCFPRSQYTDLASQQAAKPSNTYEERLRLCKVLKGFQVRTITINRALGYIKSVEQTL
ncbi:hypothetical protein INR49_012964 [Caranx melampygus]|nr:hypothetical protein INR49_012964 [Caranx melampygus]